MYEACGFPNFTLDQRAMIDISSNFTSDTKPACIIGAVSRITVNTGIDGSVSGLIYIDVKRTFD